MSKLSDLQKNFTRMIASLIIFATNNGFELTFGDAYRDPRVDFPYSHNKSLHKQRLAVDFNVFRNGRYLKEAEDFIKLGEYWESIGGSWGGRFKTKDSNHFSMQYKGIR